MRRFGPLCFPKREYIADKSTGMQITKKKREREREILKISIAFVSLER